MVYDKDGNSGYSELGHKHKHKKKGPPAHAPANGYRAKHQYGRRHQIIWKWKTASKYLKMEDDLKKLENGRRPQKIGTWKTTFSFQIE